MTDDPVPRNVPWIDQLTSIPDVLREALLNSKDDGHTLDILGYSSGVEREFAALRKNAIVEIPAGAYGAEYFLDQARRSIKTYNTPALLVAFADAWGLSLSDTIARLRLIRVLDITWNFRSLEREASEADIELITTGHEVTDGDAAHIGRVWKDGYASIKRKKDAR